MVAAVEETTIATIINTVKKDLNERCLLISYFGRSNPAFLLWVYAAFSLTIGVGGCTDADEEQYFLLIQTRSKKTIVMQRNKYLIDFLACSK
jgi:hypothetical protein